MEVLVIEDEVSLGHLFVRAIEKRGNGAALILGVASYNEADGILKPYGKDLELRLCEFPVALVDGRVLGELQGPELVKLLVAAGVKCLAISANDDTNDEMVRAGALLGIEKTQVFSVLKNALDFELLVNDPQTAIAEIKKYMRNKRYSS